MTSSWRDNGALHVVAIIFLITHALKVIHVKFHNFSIICSRAPLTLIFNFISNLDNNTIEDNLLLQSGSLNSNI